jgi:phosphoribosylformylglycinamidine cyclo-ligase
MSDPLKYDIRGVSASKDEVHRAIRDLDKGIYPNAFCKILPDITGGDKNWCNVMHADTAGTKTSAAYLYWKESGDASVWKGIAQDAIAMNVDDLACVGCTSAIILSSTIGRNRNLIDESVIEMIIRGNVEFVSKMKEFGCDIHLAGGETADVGDIVRTVDVGITAFARMKREEVVDIDIRPGDVIVGLSSSGQTVWEDQVNSGIGSNGLTSARHDLLHHDYYNRFPESRDPGIPEHYLYQGPFLLTGEIEGVALGSLLLSPTRTYLPILSRILTKWRERLHGIVHCSGGGQTKVLRFLGNVRVVKDNLFPTPLLFRLIREHAGTDWREMYQVFNMGHRLEIYTDEQTAAQIVDLCSDMQLVARVVGRVESSSRPEILIETEEGNFLYP